MSKVLEESITWTLRVVAIIFMFVPEVVFSKIKPAVGAPDEVNVVLMRILCFLAILIVVFVYRYFRRSIDIKGKNYCITVEYGDIFEARSCKKVIPFDECFSTSVGNLPADINPGSICGQYLQKNPMQNMKKIIDNIHLKPICSKSKYRNNDRYESGRLVPNADYLLMAFAKLDKSGLGRMSRNEFLSCLSLLWEEIDKYYGQIDVSIPILGSGVTRMDGSPLTQQELLDIIILSYKLNINKIKYPNKLHIVCKKRDDFSLNRIGENI